MQNTNRNRGAIIVFVLPAFILFTCVAVLTIFASIYYSTLDWNGIKPSVFVGLQNYAAILFSSKTVFLQTMKNSFILAAVSLFIQLPLAIMIAIIISNRTRGEKFFRTVYFIPVIIMTAITAQLWLKIYDPLHGLLNEVLRIPGLESWQQNWTVEDNTALASAILPGLWQWMGYYMLILYTGIKSISNDILEASRIDGAGKFRQSISILIPMIMPAIKICVTFMLVGSMKAFDLIYLITKGGPMNISEVPTITMFITIFEKNQYGLGSAMAVIIIVFCFIYAIAVNKVFKKSEEAI